MEDSVIKMVLDGDWSKMTEYTEKKTAEKILSRINKKKEEVVEIINRQ